MSIYKNSVDPDQIKIHTVFHSAVKFISHVIGIKTRGGGGGGGGEDVVH